MTSSTTSTAETGVKFDNGKPMMELIPVFAEYETARAYTYGARKYSPENWRKVENLRSRYLGAALRHINQFRQGEHRDNESGIHHLAHAIASLSFVLEDLLLKELEAGGTF